jgi:YD repeat-containing protein
MSGKNTNLRTGIDAEGELVSYLARQSMISTDIETSSTFVADLRKGQYIEALVSSLSVPVADRYTLAESFGAFTEAEIVSVIEAGASSGALVVGSDRELNPATFEVLDDKTLTYETGLLTRVTAEDGTEISLSYDASDNLIRVQNSATGTSRHLEYTSGVLTKVTSTKS